MFAKRCLMITSVSSLAYGGYPRRSYASSHAVKSFKRDSYRERIEKLNQEDKILIHENYKKELKKAYGFSHVISILPTDVIEELHYIYVLYNKPLSPERRIILRNKILPYLEKSKNEEKLFYEHLLTYYDVI
jgi:hypothetical protein